jgi:hypothetical protein
VETQRNILTPPESQQSRCSLRHKWMKRYHVKRNINASFCPGNTEMGSENEILDSLEDWKRQRRLRCL